MQNEGTSNGIVFVQRFAGACGRAMNAFSLSQCVFRVQRSKESTARIVLWRELGLARSFTLEASFCGSDRDHFKVSL